IPASAVGVYWIIAKADADDQVPETNEGNNTNVSRIKVGADLRVSALSGLPAKAGPGDTISVTDTTANTAGAAGAGPSATGFYLSSDATLDGSDALLGSRAVGPLAPGATDTASTPTPLTLPTSISP